MEEVKIYNGKSNNKSTIKNQSSVKVVKCRDMKKISSNHRPYVIELDEDFNFYLSDTPILNHEYDYMENICFLYDEMTDKEKEKYKDKVITVVLRDSNIVKKTPNIKTRKLKK